MASYNKRISDQSKIKFDPINRELIDSENSEIDSRVDSLEETVESLEENITGSKTATGKPITVTDAAPVNAVSVVIDLEPIQTGSGEPSPDNIRPISGRSQVIVTIKDNPSEPSVTKNYTIQIGQTVYGGQLDVTKGKMVVDKGYVDLGDLSWTKEDGFYRADIPNAQKYPKNVVAPWLCECYKVLSQDSVGSSICISSLNWIEGVALWNTSFASVTDVKNALSGQHLVYELATPFTIDITPTQIKLLENTNTINTDYDGDTISLKYQPNNALGELLGEVNDIYDSIIEDIYNKIDSLDTRVTALEEA